MPECHEVTLSIDDYPDNVEVASFDHRMVCTKCGMIGADARSNWPEQPLVPRSSGVNMAIHQGFSPGIYARPSQPLISSSPPHTDRSACRLRPQAARRSAAPCHRGTDRGYWAARSGPEVQTMRDFDHSPSWPKEKSPETVLKLARCM